MIFTGTVQSKFHRKNSQGLLLYELIIRFLDNHRKISVSVSHVRDNTIR